MSVSLGGFRKSSTCSILCCTLVFLFGLLLAQAARTEDQQPLLADEDVALGPVFGPVFGIDLGTSYSRISVMKDGLVEIIPDAHGSRSTPSWVAFTNETHLIGVAAMNQYLENPHRTIFDIKRIIGRKFEDQSLQQDIKRFPFKIFDNGGQPRISVEINGNEATFAPEEILSMVLGRLKDIAANYLGEPVRRAVITVPAYFNDAQRAATKEAGRMADIDVLRVVNEPTAAALAYRLDETNQTEPETYTFGLDKTSYEGQVLVYDLGAKTVDISIISIEEGVFEVRSTAGDSHIGGESFNDRVMIDMAEKYSKDYNVDITKDSTTMGKLRGEVDTAKKHLSSQESTTISIEYNGQNISESLTRAQFEALNGDLLQKTSQYVRQALGDAKMKTSDIDHIILAGGSSHIVKVQQMLEHLFGKTPRNEIDPEDVVAIGAAIQGSYLADSGRDYGCYFGETSFTSLGVEAPNGVMVPLVKRGTTLPTKKIHTFSTSANNQSIFPIRVYEGERARTEDNHKLAEFQLDIPLAPRGISQIEVTFELDTNNNIRVSALDKTSGKSDRIIITRNARLDVDAIELMLEKSEEYAKEDSADRAHFVSQSKLEEYTYGLKRQFHDLFGFVGCSKVNRDDKKSFLNAIQHTEDWLDRNAANAVAGEFDKQLEKLSSEAVPIITRASRRSWWRWYCW